MLRTVEYQIKTAAARAKLPVEEYLLRQVAENLYHLHLAVTRKLAGGSTLMPSTLPDQQAKMFDAWVEGLKSVSGRLGIFAVDKTAGLKVRLKPYSAAPVEIKLTIRLADPAP